MPPQITKFNGKCVKFTPYYKNDTPEAPDSNHSATWNNIIPFLPRLNAVRKNIYKYFKMTESTGTGGHTFADLDPTLRLLLDKIRGECGFPISINSGYRTQAQNDVLSDSVSNSAHVQRLGVDIICTDSSKRYILKKVCYANNIPRIGTGKNFIHIDISKTLPQNVEWDYYK